MHIRTEFNFINFDLNSNERLLISGKLIVNRRDD